MSEDVDSTGTGSDPAQVAEYALGLLGPADKARFVARLHEEPALRAELAEWRARFSSLDEEFAEAPPPHGLWRGIEARLFGAPAPRGLWNSAPFWRSFAAVTAAFAVMSVAINLAQPPADPNLFSARYVASLRADGSAVSFVALYNPATLQLRITGLSGEAVPDKDFELWAIYGTSAPVSLGVVPVTAAADVALAPALAARFAPGTVLAVTLEQKGGSPTHAPQGPVVASGAAAAI